MSRQIRIPRTTAAFVRGLGSILREHFKLQIDVHEHWEFEHAAQWEECGDRGECSFHGYSARYRSELEEQGRRESVLNPVGKGPCYPYTMNVYLASGQAGFRGSKLEIRARIMETRWEVMHRAEDELGESLVVQVWVLENGKIRRGVLGLMRDGTYYLMQEWLISERKLRCPLLPPRKIGF